MDKDKTFRNPEAPEEEARYWKNLYLKTVQENEELKKEYNEFEEQSKTLEAELEMLYKDEETKCKDLTATNTRLKNENEVLKERLETQTRNENAQLNELTSELSTFKQQCDQLKTYVRELEQRNDDFERKNRVLAVSIEEVEVKLNLAVEKNVILESELDEKESLRAQLQRLRDEQRDLNLELKVRNIKQEDSNRTATSPSPEDSSIPPPTLVSTKEIGTRPSRLSPLSIVNDLLRKVGALETKLATYKKPEAPPKRKHAGELIKT